MTVHDRNPIVYVVSDSIGETAERVVRAAASQFDNSNLEIRRVPYVSDIEIVSQVIEEASGFHAVVTYTMIIPELRQALEEKAKILGVPTVDIMGPMLGALGNLLHTQPRLEPGLMHKLDEEYFKRVEAIEFAVKYDDGKDPRGLLRADLVLIGVSRTSKTPLSMYLANKRYKVANVPLVPEVNPPEELFMVPASKIVGLTISPQQLNEIRQERLKSLGLLANANYAAMERIIEELEYANRLYKRLGCRVIDVTRKAIEETASRVTEYIDRGERHGR
ncbi:MAG: pyruvate, water dikinase regulatory protein [Bacillota bacterium]